MKTPVFIVALAAVILIALLAGRFTAPVSEIGRYQLVQGYYRSSLLLRELQPALSEHEQKAVFKIDTATGQTWVYDVYANEHRHTSRWIEAERGFDPSTAKPE